MALRKQPLEEQRTAFLPPKRAILAFEIAGQRYGLPVENVVQIVHIVAITHLPKAPQAVSGVIDFRGQVIPLIDMRLRLLRPLRAYTLHTPVVVSRLDGHTAGLVVDRVSGVLELLPDQIEPPASIFAEPMAPQVHHLTGVARTVDGLLLLLDPATLLPSKEETAAQAPPRRRRSRKS